MDTKKNNEAENDSFETIAPEKDNPVEREFEIGQLVREELKEDERARDYPVIISKSFNIILIFAKSLLIAQSQLQKVVLVPINGSNKLGNSLFDAINIKELHYAVGQ